MSSELRDDKAPRRVPQLTYHQTVPNAYRVSADGVEIGSISERTRYVHPVKT